MPSDCFQAIDIKEMMIRQGENMDQDIQNILQNSGKGGLQTVQSEQHTMDQELQNLIQNMDTSTKDGQNLQAFPSGQARNVSMNSSLPADLQAIKVEAFAAMSDVGNLPPTGLPQLNQTNLAKPHFTSAERSTNTHQVIHQDQSGGNQVIQSQTLLNLPKVLTQFDNQPNNAMITQALLSERLNLQQVFDNSLNDVHVGKATTAMPVINTVQVSNSSNVNPVMNIAMGGNTVGIMENTSPGGNTVGIMENSIQCGNPVGVTPIMNSVQSSNIVNVVQPNSGINIGPIIFMGTMTDRLQQIVGTVPSGTSINMSPSPFAQVMHSSPGSVQMVQCEPSVNLVNNPLPPIATLSQSPTAVGVQNVILSQSVKDLALGSNQGNNRVPNTFLSNQGLSQNDVPNLLNAEHIIMTENLMLSENQEINSQVPINNISKLSENDQSPKSNNHARNHSFAETISQLLSSAPTPHSSNPQLNTPEPIFLDPPPLGNNHIQMQTSGIYREKGNSVSGNKIDLTQQMHVESQPNPAPVHPVFGNKLSSPRDMLQLFTENVSALTSNSLVPSDNAALASEIMTNTSKDDIDHAGDVNMRTPVKPSMLERLLKGGEKSALNMTEVNVVISNSNSPSSVSSPDHPADSPCSLSPGSVFSNIDATTQSTLISKSERLHLDSDSYANEEIGSDLFTWPVVDDEEHEPNKARKCSRDADAPSSIVNQPSVDEWFGSGMAVCTSEFVFTKFGIDVNPATFTFGSKSMADTTSTNILSTISSLPAATEKPIERVVSSPQVTPQTPPQVQSKLPQLQPPPSPQTQPQTITRSQTTPRRIKEPGLTQQFPCKSRGYELRILDQPEEQHRARYLTEGSRGAVKNRSQQGHPVIQLVGYNEPVSLQVFVGCDTGRVRPHGFYQACKVAGKNSTPCSEKEIDGTTVIEIELTPINDMTASIDCVGILKLRNADVEQRIGITKAKKKSTRARIVFRVTLKRPDGMQQTVQICSTSILCTQPIGQPEICKISLTKGPITGGQELFIIGKNFMKGTKVFFQEVHIENGNVIVTWEKEADIDKDLFQPNHIICTVPEYPNKQIIKSVTAQVVVNSVGKLSEPQPYTYKPEVEPVKQETPMETDQCQKKALPFSVSPEALELNEQIQQTQQNKETQSMFQLPPGTIPFMGTTSNFISVDRGQTIPDNSDPCHVPRPALIPPQSPTITTYNTGQSVTAGAVPQIIICGGQQGSIPMNTPNIPVNQGAPSIIIMPGSGIHSNSQVQVESLLRSILGSLNPPPS